MSNESTPALDYVKQCTLCGAYGHLAHACPWNRPGHGKPAKQWKDKDGLIYRMYLRDGGALTTVEVPVTAWEGINRQGSARDRVQQWNRARAREDKRVLALEHAMQGVSATESAAQLKVSKRTVLRWRKEHLKRVHSDPTIDTHDRSTRGAPAPQTDPT